MISHFIDLFAHVTKRRSTLSVTRRRNTRARVNAVLLKDPKHVPILAKIPA